MSHKAYAFNWRAFKDDELSRLLVKAVESGDSTTLANYIDAHRDQIKDPYEGKRIDDGWLATLVNRDVQEHGDYALTRFYDPADDRGIGESWMSVAAELADEHRSALLGTPLGKPGHEFDPGLQGSYFQTPEQVVESLRRIEDAALDCGLQPYVQLLRRCAANGLGIYVTF